MYVLDSYKFRNMHAISTNQIADILHFNDKK